MFKSLHHMVTHWIPAATYHRFLSLRLASRKWPEGGPSAAKLGRIFWPHCMQTYLSPQLNTHLH